MSTPLNDKPQKNLTDKIKVLEGVKEKAGDIKSLFKTGRLNEDGKQAFLEEKSDAQVKAEMIAIAKAKGDTKAERLFEEANQDTNSRQKYRENIYKIQELYTHKAMMMQKQVAEARTSAERDKLLHEIKEIGRFCSALEGELRYLRNRF